nr:MAG TPA: hypothetical protein [Caudoviricetes sp.]
MSVRITTYDNPYSPFTEWDEWYEYDTSHGYGTCSYLDRVLYTSDELGPQEQMAAQEAAIDEIISMHPDGFYKKVKSE